MALQTSADDIQPQTRNSPVIVGDNYELVESVGAEYVGELLGGLLAKPDSQGTPFSMSPYDRLPNTDLSDYDARRSPQSYATVADYNTSRPAQKPMYLTYALPGLADPELQPPPTPYDRNLDHMVYASSMSPSRAPHEATSSVYSSFGPRKLPEVSAYNPQQGITDSHIHVYLDSSSDLLSPTPLIVSLMFATRRVPATLTRLETRKNDVYYKYVATANAPSFAETGSLDARVPVKLQLQDESGLDVGLIDVGPWLYENDNRFESLPVREASRKRKTTDESPEMPISVKRGTPPADESSEYGSYGYASRANIAYPSNLRSMDLSSMQRKLTPYGRLQDQQVYQEDSMFNLTRGPSSPQPLMRPPTTHSSAWSPSYSMGYQAGRSNVMREQTYHASPLSSDPANPPLVRASTLQTISCSGSTSGASSDGSFNPYALYTTKAVIKIRGDLNTMQDDWDVDERMARRRLVLFRGEQNGSTINTYFRAAKPDERPSTQVTRERRISCIYWEERDEYFVTSVDTIALLETLVGARFTVEEKNRIRRNLETHHPLTVSKGKSDTESFFKVIMGFPNPKPRNIEKDVKVFPWPILAQALRKVISKYSASHASTAGPLPTSQPTSYARSPTSQPNGPYLSSSSSASSTYAQTLKSATLSPTPASRTLPTYSQHSPLHSYTVPVPTLASQYPHHPASKPLSSPYNTAQTPVSIPDLSDAYTTSYIGRRRSSETASATPTYTTRPRANTSVASLYAGTGTVQSDPNNDYPSLGGLPITNRASWDFTSYLQPPSESEYRHPSLAEPGPASSAVYASKEAVDDSERGRERTRK